MTDDITPEITPGTVVEIDPGIEYPDFGTPAERLAASAQSVADLRVQVDAATTIDEVKDALNAVLDRIEGVG